MIKKLGLVLLLSGSVLTAVPEYPPAIDGTHIQVVLLTMVWGGLMASVDHNPLLKLPLVGAVLYPCVALAYIACKYRP